MKETFRIKTPQQKKQVDQINEDVRKSFNTREVLCTRWSTGGCFPRVRFFVRNGSLEQLNIIIGSDRYFPIVLVTKAINSTTVI